MIFEKLISIVVIDAGKPIERTPFATPLKAKYFGFHDKIVFLPKI